MATQLIPIEQARSMAPAKMTQRIQAGQALNTNFAEGIRDAFPTLSIRGKVFRIRAEGKEEAYIDPASRMPLPFLDIVLINGSRSLAKTYYKQGFTEGDNNPPDCWSLDSVRPDPTVVNKVNPTCADCPMNAFGSRVTDNGKAAKACQDARRICVSLPHYLADDAPRTLMLRVPQSSLKNLRAYVELLAKNGYEPTGCVTRVSFDYQEAFPKLNFNFVGPVTDAEFDTIMELAASPSTAAMLAAPDFDNAASHQQPNAAAPAQPIVRQAPPTTTSSEVEAAGGMTPVADAEDRRQQAAANRKAMEAETVAVRTSTEGLIELPDGEGWLDPETGETVQVDQPGPAARELDPDVVPMKNGKFFNKKTGSYVADQYKPEAVPTAEPAAAAPAKRTRKKAAGNGAEAAAVAAASPKLEQLLGELVPPKK